MKFLKKNYFSLVLLYIILLLLCIILFLNFKEHFDSDIPSNNDYTIKNSYQCSNNNNIVDINKEYSDRCDLGDDVLTKDQNCLNVAIEKCNSNATCLGIQEFKENKKTLAKYKLCKDDGKEIPQSSHVAYAYKLYKKNNAIPKTIQEPSQESIKYNLSEDLKSLIKHAKCFSSNSPHSLNSPNSPHSQNKCSSKGLLNNFN